LIDQPRNCSESPCTMPAMRAYHGGAAISTVPLLAMLGATSTMGFNPVSECAFQAPSKIVAGLKNPARSSFCKMDRNTLTSFAPLNMKGIRERPAIRMGVSATVGSEVKDLDDVLITRIEQDKQAGLTATKRWAGAFEELAKNKIFAERMWAKEPFKLDGTMDMAVGCFGTTDLKQHAHDYPYFYAGIGMLVDGGGWMMAKFDKTAKMDGRPDCMQADEVDEQLRR
jgi:hypothetical protein